MASISHAQNAPDPDVIAQRPLPEHDDGATLDGKTALEYADALSGGNARQSREALQVLARMGVDALPAREIVRVFAEAPDAGIQSYADGSDMKIAALSVMAAMQAPEAHALLRQKLMDPDYLTGDHAYKNFACRNGAGRAEP